MPHLGSKSWVSSVPRRRLSVKKKFAMGILTTSLFLLAVELLLAAFGVKPCYLTNDPLVGFDRGSRLFVPLGDGQLMRTNPAKLAFFNDQKFWVKRTKKTYRIFCVGGSTTYGHPYRDGTSFCGWLRARLSDADPDRDWQVINCGGISYASYRICHVMQELADYQPDLFIFYEGHNEFLEERTYGDLKNRGSVMQFADFVRTRTRMGTVIHGTLQPGKAKPESNLLSGEVEAILDRTVGPESYHRDPQWNQGVVEHFRLSLDRACGIAKSAGAKIIFVKPACNLRDFSPFKSESSPLAAQDAAKWQHLVQEGRQLRDTSRFDQAAERFIEASRIDPRHALTLWETGDVLFKAGQQREARDYFVRAIDEDVCPLRASTTISDSVVEVATRSGVPWIDFPKLLEDQLEATAGHRIPGDESFLDHLHPTIEQNRRLAWALYDQLVKFGVAPAQSSDSQLQERVSRTVLDGIDQKQHANALVQVIQVLSWAGKNNEALNLSERAENEYPGVCGIASYRGRLLEKLGRRDEAFEWFAEAVRRDPEDCLAHFRLGSAYKHRKDFESARECFIRASHAMPAHAPSVLQYQLHMDFGMCCVELQRWHDAVHEFESAVKLSPRSPEAAAALNAALHCLRTEK